MTAHRVAVVLVSLLGFAGTGYAAFVNEGFETGDLSGWTVTSSAPHGVATEGTPIAGTAVAGNYVHPHDGNFAAWAALEPSGGNSTITFTQSVLVEPDVQYQVALRVGVFGDGTPQHDFTRQWTIDGIARPEVGAIGSGGFTEAFLTTAAFAGAPRMVTYSLTIGRLDSSTVTRGFSIDDITIRAVPEPSFLGALAGPLLALRRRRVARS
jgi:hypothetical protein